jgi:hypothetical protein
MGMLYPPRTHPIATPTELPLSLICKSYYKSAQITQQRKLDVGCYSPEARTNINPCVPSFVQPSRPGTQSDKFTRWRLENPDNHL